MSPLVTSTLCDLACGTSAVSETVPLRCAHLMFGILLSKENIKRIEKLDCMVKDCGLDSPHFVIKKCKTFFKSKIIIYTV